MGKKVTLQLSTKLSVRRPSDTQTPVCTSWVAPDRARSIRFASSTLWGLPKTSPPTSTTVSHPSTTAPGWSFATARHLPRASFSTSWAGVGAVTPFSSKSLTQMVKSVVYKLRSSFRRGLPEANIRFMLFSSFSFCPWPQGPEFYDSAGFFVLREPARHAKGSPIRGAGCEAD